MRRRLRPTFLLSCVVLLAVTVAFFAVVSLFRFTWWLLLATVATWIIGIEGGLLPWIAERILIRRASRSTGTPHSLFFRDLDLETEIERAQLDEATKDNPTIR